MGNGFPGIPTSGYPPGWSHCPYLVNIFWLAYLSIILVVGPKSVTAKMLKLNLKKIPGPAERKSRPIPPNAASNGQELSEKCSIFALRQRGMPAHLRELMGLIAPSFLGTRGTRCSPRVAPIPPAFRGHTGKSGLSPFIYLIY